ncbi:MAG: hypothetical protein ABI461_08420 [Polyangiaceae bacterium]
MTIDELRSKEISIREKLVAVRGELAASKVVLAAAARAKAQLAAADGPNDGAYRKAADDRFGSLRDRVAASLPAESDRERLRAQETALMIELEENREALVGHGVLRVPIPALANILKSAPCKVRWGDMTGDGDDRTCTHCQKIVRNVAMLEARDAARFPAPDPNAPFYRRADGTILVGNCEEGQRDQNVTRAMTIGLGVVVAVVVGLLASFEIAKGPRAAVSRSTSKPVETAAPYAIDDHPSNDQGNEQPLAFSGGPVQDRLHNVTTVHVVDTTVDRAETRKIDLKISAFGNLFVGFLTCGGSNKQIQVDVPSLKVQSFFDEINVTHDVDVDASVPVACAAMSRKIQLDIVMPGHKHTATLTMNNCGPQWIENGTPLKADASQLQNPLTNRISTRYGNILASLPVTACTR